MADLSERPLPDVLRQYEIQNTEGEFYQPFIRCETVYAFLAKLNLEDTYRPVDMGVRLDAVDLTGIENRVKSALQGLPGGELVLEENGNPIEGLPHYICHLIFGSDFQDKTSGSLKPGPFTGTHLDIQSIRDDMHSTYWLRYASLGRSSLCYRKLTVTRHVYHAPNDPSFLPDVRVGKEYHTKNPLFSQAQRAPYASRTVVFNISVPSGTCCYIFKPRAHQSVYCILPSGNFVCTKIQEQVPLGNLTVKEISFNYTPLYTLDTPVKLYGKVLPAETIDGGVVLALRF